ncbi:MAG: hypothetical protein HY231_19250 [Acidobacteria bacterium]|nr:hypothetical protein [Acidobacteriota bacterium]
MNYQRSTNSSLYFAVCDDGTPNQTIAYLLPTDNQSDPSSLTLDQSWQKLGWQPYAGCYIFVNDTNYDEAKFAAAARVYLWGGSFTNARLAWFTNPDNAATQPLNAMVMFADAVDAATYKLKEVSLTISPNFTLFLAGGCLITTDDANNQLQIAQVAGRSNSIAIQSFFGTQNTPALGAAYLPLCGAQAGCLQFQIPITNTTLDENHLDVSLRYYVDDPNSPGNIISQRYPIFNPDEAKSPITAWASLYLLDAFDVTRTYFSFNGQSGTGQGSGEMPSYFRTNTGFVVNLTPQQNALSGFVFSTNSSVVADEPGDPFYAVPTGAFAIGIEQSATVNADPTVPAYRVMCGFSGVEYVGLMTEAGNTMNFVPNQFAYAPMYTPPSSNGNGGLATAKTSALGDSATPQLLAAGAVTSWIFVSQSNDSGELEASSSSSTAVQYFAQPDDSVQYEAVQQQQNLLNFMEVPAGILTASTSSAAKGVAVSAPPNCYPMAPYAGVEGETFDDFQAFELQVLSPARRNTIYSFLQSDTQPPTGSRTSTTPQGLLSTFDNSLTNWLTLTLGQSSFYELTDAAMAQLQPLMSSSPTAYASIQPLLDIAYAAQGDFEAALQAKMNSADYNQFLSDLLQYGLQVRQLQFTDVTGPLKEAMQTNQLFLVITDPTLLLNNCSFNYFQLTSPALDWIKAQNPALENMVAPLQDIFYASAADYTTGLLTKISQSQLQANQTLLFQAAAFGEIVIQGWNFNISPNTWHSWATGNTILILKYSGKSVMQLASDATQWTNGGDFNQSVANTQTQLLSVLNDAITRAKSEQEFADFASMITSPTWNGILALQCYVPLAAMPPQLQGIAAGIDPAMFYAHHIGININPIQLASGNLSMQDSSLFGLIYYDDTTDLTYNQTDYQFKVLTLKVLFKNSAIVSFASQIELYINKFFGELAVQQNSAHGNNLLLNGVYQKQGDTESYVFTEQGDNIYAMTSKVLSEVEILKAQFNTVVQPGGVKVGQLAQADFILWGNLRFIKQPAFDLFSFGDDAAGGSKGNLSFSNLLIHMSFMPDPPEGETAPAPTFVFDAGQIAFDLAKSIARPDSLYNHFPIKLKGLVQAEPATSPTDLGYMAIDSPLNTTALSYPWYGLQFELNMGGPGGLAAKIDFTATLIAAWSPALNLTAFLGIKLPGFSGSSKELTLESVLKLAIANIEFIVNGSSGYMMKFDNIALKFFMVKFPPTGQTNIYLFGDPNNQDNTTLGWYAAYAKGKKKTNNNQSPPKSLPPA